MLAFYAALCVAVSLTAGPVGRVAAAVLGVAITATAAQHLVGVLSHPAIHVELDRLVIDYPAVLRTPVTVPRENVYAVYLRDAWDVEPWFAPRDERRPQPHFSADTSWLPSLTFGLGLSSAWNVLVVFGTPVPFKDHVRRGALARTIAQVFTRSYYDGPVPRTRARGVVASTDWIERAGETFSAAGYGWATPPIPPEVLDRIGLEQGRQGWHWPFRLRGARPERR